MTVRPLFILALAAAMALPAAAALAQTRQMSPRPTVTNVVGYKVFGCQDHQALGMRLENWREELVAIVDPGEGEPLILKLAPWDGGEPRITWSDGTRTLVWSRGVTLTYTDPDAKVRPAVLNCGRSMDHGDH